MLCTGVKKKSCTGFLRERSGVCVRSGRARRALPQAQASASSRSKGRPILTTSDRPLSPEGVGKVLTLTGKLTL
ncbi:hypothetical protein GCM10009734_00470 [Nonomuraea bangladeshensis]